MNNQENNIEEVKTTTKRFNSADFFNNNKKNVLYVVGALVVIVMAYFGYKEFIIKPKEKEGIAAIREVQKFYNSDSLQHVINGFGGVPSAAEIADEYSGTIVEDQANYMAGTAYLQKGDFENAILYLKKVDFDDRIVQYQTIGALGDAYVETGELKKGLKNYKTATENLEGQLAKRFLLKAGLVMQKLEMYDDAIDWYTEGKEKLRDLPEANDMDMYIEKCKALKSN